MLFLFPLRDKDLPPSISYFSLAAKPVALWRPLSHFRFLCARRTTTTSLSLYFVCLEIGECRQTRLLLYFYFCVDQSACVGGGGHSSQLPLLPSSLRPCLECEESLFCLFDWLKPLCWAPFIMTLSSSRDTSLKGRHKAVSVEESSILGREERQERAKASNLLREVIWEVIFSSFYFRLRMSVGVTAHGVLSPAMLSQKHLLSFLIFNTCPMNCDFGFPYTSSDRKGILVAVVNLCLKKCNIEHSFPCSSFSFAIKNLLSSALCTFVKWNTHTDGHSPRRQSFNLFSPFSLSFCW